MGDIDIVVRQFLITAKAIYVLWETNIHIS